MKSKLPLLFILTTCYLILNTGSVCAQHFSSPSYIIDWGNFNITSGKKTSLNYSLTDTVGQNAPGLYSSTGYRLKSGFQYIYDTFNQFSFAIDNLDIPLGTLIPDVASTATNIITVTTPSGHGYQVIALENHPLSLASGTTIPDTSCNSATACTVSSSNIWTDANAYGFGYNVLGINSSGTITGVGTSNYFADITYYRPFSATGQIIMSEPLPAKEHSARITYRANISGVQSAGNYQNSIIITAVPLY